MQDDHWGAPGGHTGTAVKRRFVFVSHDGQDTWVTKQIARGIKAAGAEPFLDETEVAVGSDFEERLLESLDAADEFLVLLTPWSLDRPYVWAELGAAWGRRIPIVGVLYGITAWSCSRVRASRFS